MKDFTDLNGFTWKFPDRDKHFIKDLRILPEYQLKQKKMISDRPKMIDLSWVIDVGANVGLWTRWFAAFGAKRIDCFEPVPETIDCLRCNTKDLEQVTIHEVGLSDSDKTITLYNSPENPDSGFYTSVSYKSFVIPYLDVKCKTLDEFKFDPTFIKVDIQNGEMEFLLGARETISRAKPTILIEGERSDPDQPTLMWLRDLGYRLECATSSDYLMVAA